MPIYLMRCSVPRRTTVSHIERPCPRGCTRLVRPSLRQPPTCPQAAAGPQIVQPPPPRWIRSERWQIWQSWQVYNVRTIRQPVIPGRLCCAVPSCVRRETASASSSWRGPFPGYEAQRALKPDPVFTTISFAKMPAWDRSLRLGPSALDLTAFPRLRAGLPCVVLSRGG